MKELTQYRLIVYGGAFGISALAGFIVFFISPGFYYNDLCGPMVRDLSPPFTIGFFNDELQPNPMYEKENAEELIKACYTAKQIAEISMYPTVSISLYILLKVMIAKPETWRRKNEPV